MHPRGRLKGRERNRGKEHPRSRESKDGKVIDCTAPRGRSSRFCTTWGTGNTALRLSQFKDRMRRKPSHNPLPLFIARRWETSAGGPLPPKRSSPRAGPTYGREEVRNSTTFQRKLGFSYPEGNFEGNQLLGDSMSLSPLHQTQTNELHVSIETSFHRSFPRLRCILE